MVRPIEELTLNAWPAFHTLVYDGWLLRFAGGYTRRSNSVNPLYPSSKPLEEKVAQCERLYRDRGLKVVFKMTAESCPDGLDDFLAAQGYVAEAHTGVQLLELRGEGVASAGEIAEAVTEEWFEAFCRMGQLEAKHRPTAWQLLRNLALPAGFASIRNGNEVIACGLGIVEAGYVGLFDIVTDPRYRRQGHGGRVVQDLLGWGQARGAHTAHLAVMQNNEAALALYSKLGFRERYTYWYRVKA